MTVYVVSNSENHIYGVRFDKVQAETLMKKEQENLEYRGSRLLVRITICMAPATEEQKNKIFPPLNDLEFAFEQGRKYEAGELELNTEGRNTAFEVWYENNYPE